MARHCRDPFRVAVSRRVLWLLAVSMVSLVSGAARPLLFLGDKDYPPVAYLDGGMARGMDVDLVKALATPLKRELRVELMDWKLAQEKVLAGEADGLLGLTISEERRQIYDFAIPAFTREFGLLVRSGEKSIRGLSDLNGRKVGVTAGGFPRKFFESRTEVSLVLIENYRDGLNQLVAGNIDAMAADLWVAAFIMERDGIRGAAIVGKPFATATCALAVKKGNTALLQEINQALRALETAGTIAKIQEDWQPHEMLFASRAQVRHTVTLVIGGISLLVFGLMALWIITLRRQVRIRQGAEVALRESEERFRNLNAAAFEGVSISENGVILDANDQMLQMFGYERAELMGQKIVHLVAPESRATVAEAIRTGREALYEHRLLRKDGSSFHAEARAKVVTLGGRTLRMTALRDITARKQAEAERQRLTHDLGERVKELTALHAVARLLQEARPFDRALLMDVVAKLPPAWQFPEICAARIVCAGIEVQTPDWRETPWKQSAQFAVNESQTGTVEVVYLEERPPESEGPFLAEERALIQSLADMLAAHWKRQQFEQALRESEARVRELFNHTTDCVFLLRVEPNGEFVYESFNPAAERVSGFSQTQVQGRRPEEFMPPEVAAAVNARYRSCLASGINQHYEHTLTFPVGTRTFDTFLVPIRDAAGRVQRIAGFARDVTEQRRAETEHAEVLRRGQQAREQFTRELITSQEAERRRIAGELHDSLGQNLLLMKNRAQMGLAAGAGVTEIREQLEGIREVATQAIAEVRQISRDLHPYQLDHLGLTRALESLIAGVAQSTTLTIERKLEDVDEVFSQDAATNIYRVVQEGLNNILKHARATRVRIELERDVRQVRLWLQDDGCGFELVGERAPGGLGLKNIAERVRILGGTLQLRSRPGAGTTMEVFLPVATDEELPATS